MDQTAEATQAPQPASEPASEPATTASLATAPREERDRGAEIALEEFGSQEEFERALEATIKEFDDGDIVEGVVVKVDPEEVLLDIGYKSEGVIPSKELSIKHDIDPNDVVELGDVIEALVLQKEDKDGRLVLSKKRAQYERAWGKIEEIHAAESTVTGTVIEVVKGGLILDIGLRGFLPASLVEMRRVRDLHPYVGRELECKVIELDKNRNNVVLSRRKFLEETQSEFRNDFLNSLQKGEVRAGVVSSIVNFGAFVDLGGVDGLVHVSELSWKHIDHPSEVVEIGDEVEVEVLDVDRDRERVSLSLKSTQADPWQRFARENGLNDVVEGVVTKLVPFGAFVKVAEGIEGLVHISELSDRHIEVPEAVVNVGNTVEVKVIDIDTVRRRISLSMKQALPSAENADAPAAYNEEPAVEAAYSSSEDNAPLSGSLAAAFAQAGFGVAEEADTPAVTEAPVEAAEAEVPAEEPVEADVVAEAADEADASDSEDEN